MEALWQMVPGEYTFDAVGIDEAGNRVSAQSVTVRVVEWKHFAYETPMANSVQIGRFFYQHYVTFVTTKAEFYMLKLSQSFNKSGRVFTFGDNKVRVDLPVRNGGKSKCRR